MSSPFSLFKEAFELYLKNFGRLLLIVVLGAILMLVALLVVSFLVLIGLVFILPRFGLSLEAVVKSGPGLLSLPVAFWLMSGLFLILVILFFLYLQSFVTASLIAAIEQAQKGRFTSLVEALRTGFNRSFSLWLAGLLTGLLVGLGLLIFLLPGLFLAAWFSLTAYAIVSEKLSPIAGLKRSFHLVKADFWSVVLVWLLLILIGMLGAIPYLGPILSLLLEPFFAAVLFLLYLKLRQLKAS